MGETYFLYVSIANNTCGPVRVQPIEMHVLLWVRHMWSETKIHYYVSPCLCSTDEYSRMFKTTCRHCNNMNWHRKGNFVSMLTGSCTHGVKFLRDLIYRITLQPLDIQYWHIGTEFRGTRRGRLKLIDETESGHKSWLLLYQWRWWLIEDESHCYALTLESLFMSLFD
jgi:hypothetical protein